MGPHLVDYLKKKGFEVVSTYFEPISDINELKQKGEAFELDVRDKEKLKQALADFKPDHVYHLAAQSYPAVSWDKPNLTVQSNVEGTVNLFECFKELNINPLTLVACSSAEYGFVTADEVPVKETHSLKPLHPYGVSKVGQDLLTYQYFKNFGLKGIRARIFNTTGPGKVNDVCSDFTKRAVMIEKGMEQTFRVGNLEVKRAITDVRDTVRGFYLMLEKCQPGEVYNISGSTAYKIGDILNKIVEITEINPKIEIDPKLLRPTDEPIIIGDSSKLQLLTDWKQEIPLDQTLRDMINYWRKKLR